MKTEKYITATLRMLVKIYKVKDFTKFPGIQNMGNGIYRIHLGDVFPSFIRDAVTKKIPKETHFGDNVVFFDQDSFWFTIVIEETK